MSKISIGYNRQTILIVLFLGIGATIIVSVIGSQLSVLFSNVNDDCYPIPLPQFITPVYATTWDYYFDNSNKRWYNHTMGTSYVTTILYNATETREDHNADALAELSELGYKLIGVYSTDFTGKNITSIQLHLARNYNITGNFKVGVFDRTTFADRSLFNSSINSANLHNYGSGSPDYNPILGENYGLYTFNKPSGFVIGANDVIGIKTVNLSGEGAIIMAHGKTNIENSNGWMAVLQDNTIDGQTQGANVEGNGFRGTLTSTDTITVNNYTLLPYPSFTSGQRLPLGSTPANTLQSSSIACATSYSLIGMIILISLICAILFFVLNMKRGTIT